MKTSLYSERCHCQKPTCLGFRSKKKKNKKIKIKNIPPYPFSKSKVLHWDYTRGKEKTIGTIPIPMKGKVYRGGSLLLESPGPFFPIRSTRTLSRVEEWRPMLTNSPRYCYLRLFISPLLVSPVGLCPLYFHADDSCRPAFVMHDTMHFYFHFATQDLAPLSMIRSSKVIQYSRNVAAQRSRSIVLLKYYSSFLPLLPMKDASMGGKRGSGIFSPSFLFFSFVLLRWIDFFCGTARPCFFFFATNS